MAFVTRLLALAIIPVIALLTLRSWYPDTLNNVQDAILPYAADTPLFRMLAAEQRLPRSDTPLVVTAFPHWSHYEKIAKIAVALAELGYPITFITGAIFEHEVKRLHPNITFQPIHGKPDKLTDEDYEMLKTFKLGSVEEGLFLQKKALIEAMPDQHDTLQHVFRDFREVHGDSKPLLSLYDLPFMGHHPILLGAPGIKPDASFGLSCHPLTLDSEDAFPFHMGKQPYVGPDAKAIHLEANQPQNMDYVTQEVSEGFWQKSQELGAVEVHDWNIYHTMSANPDYMMMLGVPEFEFPRSDLQSNIHYFGALSSKKINQDSGADLPDWWSDIVAAKAAGKKIVAVSQGTVGTNLNDLLLPTLEALKDLDDVLVVATTVAVDVEDVRGLLVPANARVAKFIPYDLLLPMINVLVNNGGYGAVIQSLHVGIPMVLAGQGQDKNVTNSLVEWKEVGVNLGRMDPTVHEIREGVTKVLSDHKYKRNVIAMSKNFERYDLSSVFDGVIQHAIGRWQKERREASRTSPAYEGES